MADRKNVVVLVRHSPLNQLKGSEALRQSVGLTLADNEVTAIMVDAAAWLSVPMLPKLVGGGDVGKHIEALPMLGSRVEVEKESLDRYRIGVGDVLPGIEVVSAATICGELAAADAVIVF